MAIKRTYGPSLALYGQLTGESAKRTEEDRRKEKLFQMLLDAQLRREGMTLEERLQEERLKQNESQFQREQEQRELLEALRGGYIPRQSYRGISPAARSAMAAPSPMGYRGMDLSFGRGSV